MNLFTSLTKKATTSLGRRRETLLGPPLSTKILVFGGHFRDKEGGGAVKKNQENIVFGSLGRDIRNFLPTLTCWQ